MHPPVDNDLDVLLDDAAERLRRAERVAVLTGAGVSAESGVATFRGAGGLWEGHSIEEVATPRGFRRDPVLVWRFYNTRRTQLRSVQPNPGHRALAELEEKWGSDRFTVITQNVDGLHRAAGSQHVVELHGSLSRVRCMGCGRIEDRPGESLPELPRCDHCQALLRPDVVWFEEMLPEDAWSEAAQATASCQCFLVVGTSAVVWPAASLIEMARVVGAAVIEVNLEPTAEAQRQGALGLYGPSGVILPRLVQRVK
jgi:NAD-dependent deacetylase